MELTKEYLKSIHESLLERIDDMQDIILGENIDDEKLNKYAKISSYFFISAAIEHLTDFIVQYKYGNDHFCLSFIHNRTKYTGSFLEYDLVSKLLSDYDYDSISTNDFTATFYPVCKKQISQYIARAGIKTLFEQETFKDIYKAVKDERNRIAHEFTWTNNNFTAGMLVKFLKTYYVLYKYALTKV